MIDLIFSLVCSRVVIDKETNNINIQNVIEQLNITGEPNPDGILPFEIYFFALWTRLDINMPASGEMQLSFISPDMKTLKKINLAVNLQEHQKGRNVVKFPNLPLPEAGRYTFLLELNTSGEWMRVAKIPLDVVFRPQHNN